MIAYIIGLSCTVASFSVCNCLKVDDDPRVNKMAEPATASLSQAHSTGLNSFASQSASTSIQTLDDEDDDTVIIVWSGDR